jgi:hypothetical protein
MKKSVDERVERLREFFGVSAGAELTGPETAEPELPPAAFEALGRFNIEWHVIPSEASQPLDDAYLTRLYPRAPRDFNHAREHGPSYRKRVTEGHRQHQGHLIGVETTMKPRYLPGNRQFYGSLYGHDSSADPFAAYLGRAGMVNGTRYAHNYLSLRTFINVVSDDWRRRSLRPAG